MTRARDVANLIGSGNYSSTTFTATAGQTAFTISHTQGFVQVFMNGLLLDETVDYTSNGSAVTLTSGAAAGDEIEVVAYNTFSVGDALNQAAADTRYVNTSGDTMTGDLTVGSSGFFVDVSDDVVGVGTTSPATPIAKFGGSAKGLAVKAGQPTVAVEASANSQYVGYLGQASTNTYLGALGGGSLIMQTGTSGTTRMTINHDGIVTMPNQPGFWVQAATNTGDYQSGPIVFSSSNSNVTTSSLISNGGTHFNTTNGRFTAPVAGLYQFNAQVRLDSFGGSYSYATLWDSGAATFGRDLTSINTTYYTHTLSATRYLSANDYVYVTLVSGGDSSVSISSDSFFSGFLLG